MSLYSDVVLASGPSLYFRFGATGLLDQSGNGRNGTYVGSPSAVAGALASDSDTGILVDGFNDQYVTTTYAPFVNGTVRTFEGWFNLPSVSYPLLFGTSGGTNRVICRTNFSVNGYELFMGYSTLGSPSLTFSPSSLPTGHYAHFVFVFDEPGNNFYLYLDGVLASTQTTTDQWQASLGTLTVCNTSSGDSSGVAQSVDEYAVYERGLTSSEILSHYLVGKYGVNWSGAAYNYVGTGAWTSRAASAGS